MPTFLADKSALARRQTRAEVRENTGLTVLHYDADYDRIAQLTGQSTQWIVPRGSIS